MIARKDKGELFIRIQHPIQFKLMPLQIYVLNDIRPVIGQDKLAERAFALGKREP